MTLTYAQRLALDHRERTNGYDDDPSLAEQHELADDAFRHFDTFTFQLHARGPRAAGTDARERGAAASSDDTGGAPTNREALAPTAPPEGQSLASSWQTWAWTP